MAKYNGGFIGLLMLLVGVAIISFLIVRSDLFTGGASSKNSVEGGFDAINAAKNAKNLIEQNSRNAAAQ